MKTSPATLLAEAKHSREADYASFLEHLSVKDKARMQKHEQTGQPDPFSELWKRLAGTLARLASHVTEFCGADAVRFYVADGKYKQQVYALERTKTGTIIVFMPDVLAEALDRKLIERSSTPSAFNVPGTGYLQMQLDVITADTRDMPACKNMLGWGRRALRVELRETDDERRIQAIEGLCKLAAEAQEKKQAG